MGGYNPFNPPPTFVIPGTDTPDAARNAAAAAYYAAEAGQFTAGFVPNPNAPAGGDYGYPSLSRQFYTQHPSERYQQSLEGTRPGFEVTIRRDPFQPSAYNPETGKQVIGARNTLEAIQMSRAQAQALAQAQSGDRSQQSSAVPLYRQNLDARINEMMRLVFGGGSSRTEEPPADTVSTVRQAANDFFQRTPILSDIYAAGRATGQGLGINVQDQPQFSIDVQPIVSTVTRGAEDLFTKTPYISAITGPAYTAGRAVGIQNDIENMSKQVEIQRDAYLKAGVIVPTKEGGEEWRGSQPDFANYIAKINLIGVKQAEYDKLSAQLTAQPKLPSGAGGRSGEGGAGGGLITQGFYDWSVGATRFWDEKVNKPFADFTAPLTGPVGQQVERAMAPTSPFMLVNPLLRPLGFMSPTLIKESSYGFVTTPGAFISFLGTAAAGGEILGKTSPTVWPALVAAGFYLQAKGLYQGLTGETQEETGLTPTAFIAQQAGMLAMFEGAGKLLSRMSPIGVGTAEYPIRGMTPAETAMLESGGMPKIPANAYTMAYLKMPFSAEARGGVPLAGIGRMSPAPMPDIFVSSSKSGYRYALDLGGLTRWKDQISSTYKPFAGSPVRIMAGTRGVVSTPWEAGAGEWNRAQYIATGRFIERFGGATERRLWTGAMRAIEVSHSPLYRTVQHALIGEEPNVLASRETLTNMFTTWDKYQKQMVVGGSRTLAAEVGVREFIDVSKSDFDVWVKGASIESLGKETLATVRQTEPVVSGVATAEKVNIATRTPEVGKLLVQAHQLEMSRYMAEDIVRLKTVAGTEVMSPSLGQSFRLKVSGALPTIRFFEGGVIDFLTGRTKDIPGAYIAARGIARELYEQAPAVDIYGAVTAMKMRRAAAMIDFSETLREYSRGLPSEYRGDIEARFSQIRRDVLAGVNRYPSPNIDVGMYIDRAMPGFKTTISGDLQGISDTGKAFLREQQRAATEPRVGGRVPSGSGEFIKKIPVEDYQIQNIGREHYRKLAIESVGYTRDVARNIYPTRVSEVGRYPAVLPLRYTADFYSGAGRDALNFDNYPSGRIQKSHLIVGNAIYPSEVPSQHQRVSIETYPRVTPGEPPYPDIPPNVKYPPLNVEYPRPPQTPEYPRYPQSVTPEYPLPKIPSYPPPNTSKITLFHGRRYSLLVPYEVPTLLTELFKPEKKSKRRRKKYARVSEEWYIWNPVPLLEDIFGHRMGYTVTEPHQRMIQPTAGMNVKPPRYKLPKVLRM